MTSSPRSSSISPETADAAVTPNAALELLADGFDQHYAKVFRYLLHRFFDKELAEELTAETFYKAASAVNRFRGDVNLLEFLLLRTATNVANTHHRRMRWRRRLLGILGPSRPAATESDPATDLTRGSDAAHVRRTLLSLPPGHQTVLVLRYYSGMSFDEIATVLGCRPDAARTRLSRAVREMRRRLGADDTSSSQSA